MEARECDKLKQSWEAYLQIPLDAASRQVKQAVLGQHTKHLMYYMYRKYLQQKALDWSNRGINIFL